MLSNLGGLPAEHSWKREIHKKVMREISRVSKNIHALRRNSTTSDEESSMEYLTRFMGDMQSLFLQESLNSRGIEGMGGLATIIGLGLPLSSSYKTILLICERITSSLNAGDNNQAIVDSLEKLFPVYKTFYSLYKDLVESALRRVSKVGLIKECIFGPSDDLRKLKKLCLNEMIFYMNCFLECKDDDLTLKLYNGYKKNSPVFNTYRMINGKYLHYLSLLFSVCVISCVILSLVLRTKPQGYIFIAFFAACVSVTSVVSVFAAIKEIRRALCDGVFVEDKRKDYREEVHLKLQNVTAAFGNTHESFLKIIGLDPAANHDDRKIKAAVKKTLLRLHPDRPGGDKDKFIKFRNIHDLFKDGSLGRSGKESVTVLTREEGGLLDRVEKSGMSKDWIIIQSLNVLLNKRAYYKVLNNHLRKVNAKIALCISVPIIFMISGLASALSFHYCGMNIWFLRFAYSCIGIGFFLSFIGLYNTFQFTFVEKRHVSYLKDIVDNTNEDSIHRYLDDVLYDNQAENTQYHSQRGDSQFPSIGDFLKYNLSLIISPILVSVSDVDLVNPMLVPDSVVESCSALSYDTEDELRAVNP